MDPGASRVTVGIPTWNRARLLAESLESVLDQTLADIEVFVSDDASTDETPSVVASFDDPRLHYARLSRRSGLHANLTRCLRLGTAPYVAICQDDDRMLPHNLERLVEVLDRQPGVGVAHGAFRLIGPDGELLRDWAAWGDLESDTIEPGEVFIRRSMAAVNRINMSSALFRRSVVAEESFEEADGLLCDTGLWLRLARRSDVAFVAEPLTELRIHPESVSSKTGLNSPGLYFISFQQIDLVQQVKERFLASVEYEQVALEELREISHRWAQRELLKAVTRSTVPRRSPIATVRLLREAARIEPSLPHSVRTWRVLLASLVGVRGRRLARRLLGGSGSMPST